MSTDLRMRVYVASTRRVAVMYLVDFLIFSDGINTGFRPSTAHIIRVILYTVYSHPVFSHSLVLLCFVSMQKLRLMGCWVKLERRKKEILVLFKKHATFHVFFTH